VVPVELIGGPQSRVVDMALDTGATFVMVPWHVAEALGHDPAVSRKRTTLTTASSVEVTPIVTFKSVRALALEVQDIETVCHDLPPGSRVEGLLGLSFLKHLDLDVHFRRGVLEARGSR